MKARSFRSALTAACLFAVLLLIAPSAYGQRDVHAVLVAKANRKPAPVFHLVSDSGKTVQIADFHGKVVLVNFWATKCGGCVLEIPTFVELQQRYGSSGFTAVGISADVSYDSLASPAEAWPLVRPFMASHGMNYPILMGDDAVIHNFGFENYPATYLIDRSGRIAATYIGVVSKSDIEANIRLLLAER